MTSKSISVVPLPLWVRSNASIRKHKANWMEKCPLITACSPWFQIAVGDYLSMGGLLSCVWFFFIVVLVFWVVWPVIILCPGRFKPTWGKNTRTYTIKRNNNVCHAEKRTKHSSNIIYCTWYVFLRDRR